MIRLVHSASQAQPRSLDDEAIAWVARLTAGGTSHEDHEDFRRWRDQGPEHLAALQHARAVWQKLDVILPAVEQRQHRQRRRASAFLKLAPLAASIALMIMLGHHYWTIGRFDQVTGIGERRAITLADGSRIVMSGQTAFNVTTTHGIRRIDLARGEIFIRVRHEPLMPFVVHAGEASFRDVGTVFDVARNGEGARLVVLEGLVEASRDDRRQLVRGGEMIAVDGGLGSPRVTDAQAEVAWAGGRLILRNRTLPQILDALAPFYKGRIVLLRSTADAPLLSAAIDLDHIDEWLVALEQMQKIRATRIAGYTILT